MKKLIITHGDDGNWYIKHGDDEHFFKNFEEVSRWVENIYFA